MLKIYRVRALQLSIYTCEYKWRGIGELFLAFLMTVLSQPFFPFMGCDLMSFSFLSAGHTLLFF